MNTETEPAPKFKLAPFTTQFEGLAIYRVMQDGAVVGEARQITVSGDRPIPGTRLRKEGKRRIEWKAFLATDDPMAWREVSGNWYASPRVSDKTTKSNAVDFGGVTYRTRKEAGQAVLAVLSPSSSERKEQA